MTPGPRNVRDSLLTAGYSFEEVERMLRAADGRIEEGLAAALHLFDYAGDFRNGNTHDGIDEGDVMASRMIEARAETCSACHRPLGPNHACRPNQPLPVNELHDSDNFDFDR